jgi:hypothetical protein
MGWIRWCRHASCHPVVIKRSLVQCINTNDLRHSGTRLSVSLLDSTRSESGIHVGNCRSTISRAKRSSNFVLAAFNRTRMARAVRPCWPMILLISEGDTLNLRYVVPAVVIGWTVTSTGLSTKACTMRTKKPCILSIAIDSCIVCFFCILIPSSATKLKLRYRITPSVGICHEPFREKIERIVRDALDSECETHPSRLTPDVDRIGGGSIQSIRSQVDLEGKGLI